MTSDLQSLLAAIVADPSDDVARLAYADCLQEHGNSPRAEFIRLQVEAERHHPESNTRADLDQRADALFAEHWIEWWGEVCAAVGFPLPAPKPAGRLGRLASRIKLRSRAGQPYSACGYAIFRANNRIGSPFAGQGETIFRRGFPDSIQFSGAVPRGLTSWALVSPLCTLAADLPRSDDQLDKPYFAGIRDVSLRRSNPETLQCVLQSVHFSKLEELSLGSLATGYWPADLGEVLLEPSTIEPLVTAPRARQLKRLAVPVWSDRAAEVLASAGNLSGLEKLAVELSPGPSVGPECGGRWLASLARSPHLAGVKELVVTGELDANGFASVFSSPTWVNLQRLVLTFQPDFSSSQLHPLAESGILPRLADLYMSNIHINHEAISIFTRSPLLKQLRHFSLFGRATDNTQLAMLRNTVDANRIETFALMLTNFAALAPGIQELCRHFGDKLRVYLACTS